MSTTTPRSLLRTALVVALASSMAGCIIVPRDPWGGHGKHRRGGHHLDQPAPQQPQGHDPRRQHRGDGRG